ncbi:MAG: S1C family serine protease [Planctomycetota bacterium]
MMNRQTIAFAVLFVGLVAEAVAQDSVSRQARQCQQRVVKIYGAGGMAGLEPYQSGFLVSPVGHVATAWSYVLDVEPRVVLDDGSQYEAEIVGFEPTLELAVLKIEATDLPYFRLPKESQVQWGDSVLAVSNLFGIAAGDEPASVMQGTIATVTKLSARRGVFKTAYSGPVYVLDLVANNPGAAGGAVIRGDGTLIGMLGKELRDARTGVWLNYALPVDAIREAISDIVAGRTPTPAAPSSQPLPRDQSHDFATLGLVMIPDVLESTPAFVDRVINDSPAEESKLRPDDLVLLINGARVKSQRSLRSILRTIDRRDPVQLTVQRENEILPFTIRP